MTYPFAKDFTYTYYPLVNEENTAGVVTSQTPAIYLFDQLPSLDAARDGTGAIIPVIASWSWSATTLGWTFTVPAIDDPEPTSAADQRTYFLGINFILQTSKQIQTVVEALMMERVRGQSGRVAVTETELAAKWSFVNSYTTDTTQRNALIAEAQSQVKARLAKDGFIWSQIVGVDKLSDAVAFKTLANIALGQIRTPGFEKLYAEFKAEYENALAEALLDYDSDNNADPDTQVAAGSDTLWVHR